MKQVTRWRPDTCGCVLEYEWEDTEDLDTRTVTHKKTVVTCSAHARLKDQGLYDAVHSENTRKNITFGLLIEDLTEEEKAEAYYKYKWRFDQNRVLIIDFEGTSAEAKASVEARLNTRFGVNKVKFEGMIEV